MSAVNTTTLNLVLIWRTLLLLALNLVTGASAVGVNISKPLNFLPVFTSTAV